MSAFDQIKEFIALADEVKAIADSGADWETKYDLIFREDLSRRICHLCIPFDWWDPDTSEEEDVRAFAAAVTAKANELRKIAEPEKS